MNIRSILPYIILLFVPISVIIGKEPTHKIITVDLAGYGGPDIAYWRGAQGPGMKGFLDNNNQRECLRIHAENGMKIYNGTRRLATDPEKEDFYINSNGKPSTKPIDEYVNIKKYVNTLGMELISMLDGTPSWVIEVERNTFHWGNPNFSDKAKDAIKDQAPLPKEGKPMKDFQRLFVEFALESDAAVAPGYNSIWIGTQEIAHTIGWRNGIVNNDTKKEAIRRYVDFWKPIADSLRAYGKKVGGIQLNSSNADLYDYAVDYMVEKNLKMDFLTFQFYQWGREKPMKLAAESVRKYRKEMNMPDTKLIIDRGSHGKLTKETDSKSHKFITFLEGEKFCMDQADVVYAYTLDCGVGRFVKDNAHKSMEWKTKYWLMNCGDPESPNKRRPITGLCDGLDGFMTTKGKDIYGVIWCNNDDNVHEIEIHLKNTQNTIYGLPKITKASDNEIYNIDCKFSNNIVQGITIKEGEYILIEIKQL